MIPVLLWSFSAITLGTAMAGESGVRGWYYLGAVALGVLIQGVLAHTVNEIEDWRSGTDRHGSPRVISGGSKVLAAGLLTPRALKLLFAAAFALTTVLGLTLVASRGLVMLPFGLAGVGGAVLYTLPPVRAAYRPFLGEAVAFVCLWLCVDRRGACCRAAASRRRGAGGAGRGRLRRGHADGAPLPRPRGRPLGHPAKTTIDRAAGARAAAGCTRSAGPRWRWPPPPRRPCQPPSWCRWWSPTPSGWRSTCAAGRPMSDR